MNRWSPETRRWVVIGLIVGAIILIYAIRDTLSTFALALLAAYLLNPIVQVIQTRARVSRVLATAIVYLLFIAVLIAILATMVPLVYRQIGEMGRGFDRILSQSEAAVKQLPFLGALGIDAASLNLVEQLRDEAGSLARSAPRVLIGAASGVFNLLLILVLSFYLVKDAEELGQNLDNAIPAHYRDEWQNAKQELGSIWANFLRGQVLLAIIIGVVTTIVLAILGVPNAALLGLIAGLLEVVPTLGPIIAAVPAVVIAFVQGSTNWAIDNTMFAFIVVIAYLLIQQLENHLIVPNVLGASVNLPPIIILFGALAGASLAGVLGVFLAAPLLATARVALRLVFRRLLVDGA